MADLATILSRKAQARSETEAARERMQVRRERDADVMRREMRECREAREAARVRRLHSNRACRDAVEAQTTLRDEDALAKELFPAPASTQRARGGSVTARGGGSGARTPRSARPGTARGTSRSAGALQSARSSGGHRSSRGRAASTDHGSGAMNDASSSAPSWARAPNDALVLVPSHEDQQRVETLTRYFGFRKRGVGQRLTSDVSVTV